MGEIPTPAALSAEAARALAAQVLRRAPGRRSRATSTTTPGGGEIAASLAARGDTAVFSHYVATNAVVSQLLGDAQVLAFRPDHASITVLETDGETLTLVEKGPRGHDGRALGWGGKAFESMWPMRPR